MKKGFNRNKKGFALVATLLFGTFFLILIGSVITRYSGINNELYKGYKKLQASNYASEGIEMTRGYMLTEIGKNRIDGWRNKIAPLSGKYIVNYNNGYSITNQEYEVLEQNEPYVVDYVRTIEIKDGIDSNEKEIVSTVDFGENYNIQYTTTITNIYGKE